MNVNDIFLAIGTTLVCCCWVQCRGWVEQVYMLVGGCLESLWSAALADCGSAIPLPNSSGRSWAPFPGHRFRWTVWGGPCLLGLEAGGLGGPHLSLPFRGWVHRQVSKPVARCHGAHLSLSCSQEASQVSGPGTAAAG